MKSSEPLNKSRLEFPKGFLWGAGSSAFQVEGGNIWNDWYTFYVKNHYPYDGCGGKGADHYHLYEKDFEMAKSMNHNAQRIGIEWSRIEKKKGEFDQKEIEHYKAVLKCMKANGFKTFVTLHHFANPGWFAAEGAWTKGRSVSYFVDFVKRIVPELDEYVDFWATINEPMVMTSHGYLMGVWPPNLRNPFKFVKASINMSRAHKKAYDAIKKINPSAQVGLTYNFGFYVANNFWQRLIVKPYYDYSRNYLFMNRVKDHVDYIGAQYYFPGGKPNAARTKEMDWPIYPKGLTEALVKISKRYKKPIYITECGIADGKDVERRVFIKGHVIATHKAIASGADVKGFLYWSLLDNLELAEGFEKRFGLIVVDFETQKRTVRESAKYYAEIARENAVEV